MSEFDKEEYWKRRNNTITDEDGNEVRKPLRGEGDKIKPVYLPNTNSKAEMGFTNEGTIVLKNREYRRRKIRLEGASQFTKKQTSKKEVKRLRKLGRK